MGDMTIAGNPRLDTLARALVARLSPARRRALLAALMRDIRRQHQARMAAGQDPDGTAWTPRLSPPRKGKPRRMMAGLIRARTLRVTATPDTGTSDTGAIGYTGAAARVARVHHFGLIDHVAPDGPRVRYEVRRLLGFTAGDTDRVRQALIDQLRDG